MQKVNCLQGKRRNIAFFLTALLVVVADQLSKTWIRSNFAMGQALPEEGFFRLTHVHNYGAAFGLFQGQTFILITVALAGVAVILLYAFFIYRQFPFLENVLGKLALGLVLGGTVGNLIDRLRLGYVTDFIGIGIWPSFNIADSAVTVGIIIVAYSLLRQVQAEKQ